MILCQDNQKALFIFITLGNIQSIVTLHCGDFENDFMLSNSEDVIVGIWTGF